MARSIATSFVCLVLLLSACSGSEPTDEQPTDESAAMTEATTAAQTLTEPDAPVFWDARTIVVPAGIDVTGGADLTTHTPSDSEVALVVAAVDSSPELAWAIAHTRFVTGFDRDGTVTIAVDFSCDDPPASIEQAIVDLQNLSAVGDGGDCYGLAVFDTAGVLLRWNVNGEA